MSVYLNLGEFDIPHGRLSTPDLARILEHKYSLFHTFYALHTQEIARDAAQSVGAMLMGRWDASDVHELKRAKSLWYKFLRDVEHGIYPKAALAGESSRFKRRVPVRISKRAMGRVPFVDTGLYRANFVAWVDHDG